MEKLRFNNTTRISFYRLADSNETVLVLQPPVRTKLDGSVGGDGNFPNSYIYDQTSIIEWKF